MIVAIDGPAGAGKSAAAREVARRFGFSYLDTGAMYRAVALAAREKGLQLPGDREAIARLAEALPLEVRNNGCQIFLGERDVSEAIRAPDMGELTSQVSTIPEVRHAMVAQQRRLALHCERECGGTVLEGRDIQTVVFPDAAVKIFLTAFAQTRAQRRLQQWHDKGREETFDHAQTDVLSRDERDSSREDSPLRPAPDATIIQTDGMTLEEVVQEVVAIVAQKKS